ncbi:MAG: DUF423 domain-containing protein [Chitinophagales bacterium]
MSKRLLQIIAAICGFKAVALGAFGAHGLRDLLDAHQHEIYEKAVMYQFFHTLAMLIALQLEGSFGRYSAISFLVGIFFFSGSIYGLATAHLTGISTAILGPVTPIGGVFFLIGWALLGYGYFKEKR